MDLADKLHPTRFTAMSGKMAAIVGYVLGETWTDPSIVEMCVTSDGFVMARQDGDIGLNEFVGRIEDLEGNWRRLLDAAELTDEERVVAEQLYGTRVTDWRHVGV